MNLPYLHEKFILSFSHLSISQSIIRLRFEGDRFWLVSLSGMRWTRTYSHFYLLKQLGQNKNDTSMIDLSNLEIVPPKKKFVFQ